MWTSITSKPALTAFFAACAQVFTMARQSSAVSWRGVSHPGATGSLVGPTGCHSLAPALISSGVSGPMPSIAFCEDDLRPPCAS